MFIRKTSQQHFKVVDKRDFFDTEIPVELTAEQVRKIGTLQADIHSLQTYLEKVYNLKRQGASTSEVPIPECLKEQIEEAIAEQQQKEQVTEVPLSAKSRKPRGRPASVSSTNQTPQ